MTESEFASMGDAAYASNLDGTSFDAVAGYLQAPYATHGWSKEDWSKIPGPKLPVYVASPGNKDGINDARSIVQQLRGLSVPTGKLVAVDMETMTDMTYINHMFAILHHEGYKLWVYGSYSSVFNNPSCNGYWVADYEGKGAFMVDRPKVRATQYKRGDLYDSSLVRRWCFAEFWQ